MRVARAAEAPIGSCSEDGSGQVLMSAAMRAAAAVGTTSAEEEAKCGGSGEQDGG